MNKSLHLIFFCLLNGFLYGQNPNELDSLLKLLPNDKNDTNKVKHLIFISEDLCQSDLQKSLEYGKQALAVAERLQWKKGMAAAYMRISYALDALGNFSAALENRLKELQLWKDLNYQAGICEALGTIGISYSDQGYYIKAMEYYLDALKLAEEFDEKEKIITNLCNIASVHSDHGDHVKALEYYFKSRKQPKNTGTKILSL
ncbi:MAG: tetratricopeptide repeat protein [Bacteroidia bacterium]|nr:tetratricopeptide repeat protein [Bacteroidia bacterium]